MSYAIPSLISRAPIYMDIISKNMDIKYGYKILKYGYKYGNKH